MSRSKEATVLFLGVITLGIVGLAAQRLGCLGGMNIQNRLVVPPLPSALSASDHAPLMTAIDACCRDYDYFAAMDIISANQQVGASVVKQLQTQVLYRAVERFNELLDGEDYDGAYSHAVGLRRLFGQQGIIESMMQKAELGSNWIVTILTRHSSRLCSKNPCN